MSICYSDSSSDSEEEFNNFEVKSLDKEENLATNSEVETIKEDSEKKPTTSKEESKPQLEDISEKRKKESSTIQVKSLKKETISNPSYPYWMA